MKRPAARQGTAPASEEPPRAWQRMLSGRRLDLLDPSPLDIEIEDIAHGLARVARWNGQTTGAHALSVAQHSLGVEEVVGALNASWPARYRLMALLHDAPEYVIGDLISPFKSAIGLDYRAFEKRLLAAIHVRFALPPHPPADVVRVIKQADRILAYFEATRLAGFSETEAERLFSAPPALPSSLEASLTRLAAWPTADAQRRFLQRFNELAG
jgi:5'-deoxynucleotidase YfbR-like HD superfamily hydrolase